MVKIKLERNDCIGCGSCSAVCPEFWEMGDDAKVNLKNAKTLSNGNQELEIHDIRCNKEAEELCPVDVIHIQE